MIGEAKRPGADLAIAQDQAHDYLYGGSVGEQEFPNYVLCSNFESFRLQRLGAPEDRWEVEFSLDEICDYVDQLKFLADYDTVSRKEEEEASIQASKLMAELFTAMAGDEVDVTIGDKAPTNEEDEDERTQCISTFLTGCCSYCLVTKLACGSTTSSIASYTTTPPGPPGHTAQGIILGAEYPGIEA